jgi:AICAR transformylase/IMP cyclohydrolase PurH
MAEHGIEAIDLVAVNLYPFAATVARPGCTFDDAVENIDIGGPAMVRASAKNHDRVTIIVDPLDYGTVLAEIDREGGSVSAETRLRLATKAFAHTAQYDATVAAYLDRAARNRRRANSPNCSRCSSASASTCATARIRTSRRRSTSPRTRRAHRSARPRSCRARSCRSTTSPTRTPRSSACGSSRPRPA